MFKIGSGYVVRITFEKLTSTYVIYEPETGKHYRYHGRDYNVLEFKLSEYVTFRKLNGVEHVVGVEKYDLKAQDIPTTNSENEISDINTDEVSNDQSEDGTNQVS
jgi:hypothetical protein